MFWWRLPENKNFGDVLGPYIVSKLSGKKIRYVPITTSKKNAIILFLAGIFSRKYRFSLMSLFINISNKPILVTAGSIMSSIRNVSTNVWGTGIMFRYSKISNANFLAIRGKYTQMRLLELGHQAPAVLGDPALLISVILPAARKKTFKLGIIPHHIHYDEVKIKYGKIKDVIIINLYDDIEKVIAQITSCEKNISTSLHGIIVSHAYNVPCLWYTLSEKKLGGDNIKFLDYFSSVNIEEYQPFTFTELVVEDVIFNIEQHSTINAIQNDINYLQHCLLKSAPFPILERYQSL